MFSFAADNHSDSEEEELDFSSAARNKGAGLGNIFGGTSQSHQAESNSALVYQAPKQPGKEGEMRNVEIVQTENINRQEERLEVMSSVRSGVKMATAVSAYKYESSGYESLGKMGLAIIGKKESNCYQLLLYRGKQSAVTVANISPRFNFRVQQDNYANFVDEGNKSWTVCFDSQDVLINFSKQLLLCKAMFGKEEVVSSDLVLGEGREVELGDSLEVQMTSWMVDAQSLSRMIETTRNKEKGLRFKLGGRNTFSGLESNIVGMKKGGRRFLIAPTNNGRTAYDIEITKLKAVEVERRVPIDVSMSANQNNNNILERVAKVGQPLLNHPKNIETPLPDLEDVSSHKSAFSTPRSTRKSSAQEAAVRTTPIPIIRGDSPASLRSGNSISAPVRVMPVVDGSVGASYGSEFNMLMSETRIQNTEMRMNVQRISDKMDLLLHGQHTPALSTPQADVTGKLDAILEQNKEIKMILGRRQSTNDTGGSIEDNLEKQQKLNQEFEKIRLLKLALREKEQHLEEELQRSEARVQELQGKLEEQQIIAERSQAAARAEVRKVLGSTARLLVAQFTEGEEYSGESVRETITQTLGLVADKLQEKYGDSGTRRGPPPPVAAVAPVPAEVEEWAEGDE